MPISQDEKARKMPARFRRRRLASTLISRLTDEERRQLCEAVGAPAGISDEQLVTQVTRSLVAPDGLKDRPMESVLRKLGY